MLFCGCWRAAQGDPLATRYPGMHAWRSLIGVLSLGAWFYAIAHMPLATAMTLNYMSSVWIAAFLVGGALLAWVPIPGRDGSVARAAAAGPAGADGAGRLRRRGADAQAHGRRQPGLRRHGGPAVRPDGRLRLHAGDGAVAARRARDAHGVLFRASARPSRAASAAGRRLDAVGRLELEPCAVAAAGGRAGRAGPALHDARLRHAKTASGTLVVANLQYSGIVFRRALSVLLFGDRIDLRSAGAAWR